LKSSHLARIVRKVFNLAARRSEPNQRLVHTTQYAGISIMSNRIADQSKYPAHAIRRDDASNVLAGADRVIRYFNFDCRFSIAEETYG
jgi:hypothetical protein